MLSRILELEQEMTLAVLNGHKPHNQDNYEAKRIECKLLRNIIFSKYEK